MQTVLSKFDYLCPHHLDELLAMLEQYGKEAQITAGGTDIIPAMTDHLIQPQRLIDIGRIEALNGVVLKNQTVHIGATTSLNDIMRSPLIIDKLPVLAEAVSSMANPQVRNRATIGGNIINASPAADTAPALLILNSRLRLMGPSGERSLPLNQFFQGYRQTALLPGEILTAIEIPLDKAIAAYKKLGKRKAACLSVASAAVALILDDHTCHEVRIALGAVAPTPIRALQAEALLKGKPLNKQTIEATSRAAAGETDPITDARASKEYRSLMSEILVRRCLNQLNPK